MTEQSTSATFSASSPVANPFTWCDIEVADLKQAESFFGEVFGWEFVPFGDDFALATKDGVLLCGVMKAEGPVAGRGLRGYIGTDDLEGTLKRVEAAGGSVAKTRREIGGDFGWWASFRDPSGILLGLATDKPAT